MTPLPQLMVAPNGARRGKTDHPHIPITLPEIVTTATACHKAGADGLHLHLRDGQGRHVLDAGLYAESLAELALHLPDMALQITTESVGRYAPRHQRCVALESGAKLVSASVAELMAQNELKETRVFFQQCKSRNIALQHIIYDPAHLDLLATLLPESDLHDPALQLIFVLGRYGEGRESAPADLLPYLQALRTKGISPDWAVCAFGVAETACLRRAHQNGGKMRVGFENSLWNADGSLADDNAERVREVVAATTGQAPASS